MSAASRGEIAELVLARLGQVLATDVSGVGDTARFEEDLAADSLDRVEVVEAVEADLRSRGVRVSLPDGELAALHTVGDAIDRLHARVAGEGAAP